MIINISNDNTNKANINGQATNWPHFPSTVQIKSPIAQGATNTQGADALCGVKFKLILHHPTWNKAFQSHANTIDVVGNDKNIILDNHVKMHPNIVISLGFLKKSIRIQNNDWNQNANTL